MFWKCFTQNFISLSVYKHVNIVTLTLFYIYAARWFITGL